MKKGKAEPKTSIRKPELKKYSAFEIWYPFILVLAVNLIVLLTYKYKNLYGDAQGYMDLSRMFIKDGHFSLLNYANPLRGYFFPLLLQAPIQFASWTGLSEIISFRLFSAIVISFVSVFVIPWFFEQAFNFQAKPLQRLIFSAFITLFWYGCFAYPLSDFPAMFYFLGGLALCFYAIKSDKALWVRCLSILAGGFCLAAATSIRLIYMIPLILAGIFIIIKLALSKIPASVRVILAVLLIVGSIISLTPQFLSNRTYLHSNSPFPLNQMGTTTGSTSVFSVQMFMGLRQQRNDFGAKLQDGTVSPMLGLPDSQGNAVANKEQVPAEANNTWTLGKYLSIFFHHPLDMTALYLRHLFDGTDLVYPATYVPNILSSHDLVFYRFMNYTLWFITIMLVWKRGINFKKDWQPLLLILITLIPALSAVAGMVEIRYFLQFYIFVYGAVGFWFFYDRKKWREFLTWRHAVLYVGYLAVCFSASSYLFSLRGVLLVN